MPHARNEVLVVERYDLAPGEGPRTAHLADHPMDLPDERLALEREGAALAEQLVEVGRRGLGRERQPRPMRLVEPLRQLDRTTSE